MSAISKLNDGYSTFFSNAWKKVGGFPYYPLHQWIHAPSKIDFDFTPALALIFAIVASPVFVPLNLITIALALVLSTLAAASTLITYPVAFVADLCTTPSYAYC